MVEILAGGHFERAVQALDLTTAVCAYHYVPPKDSPVRNIRSGSCQMKIFPISVLSTRRIGKMVGVGGGTLRAQILELSMPSLLFTAKSCRRGMAIRAFTCAMIAKISKAAVVLALIMIKRRVITLANIVIFLPIFVMRLARLPKRISVLAPLSWQSRII